MKMIRQGRSFSGRERNCCFLNTGASATGGERFANISAISGFDFPDDGRALSIVDWDQDGDLDVWATNRAGPQLRFLRNNSPQGNHFVELQLVGNGSTTNRDAIGARVELSVLNQNTGLPKAKLIKTLRAGEGFLSQSSKWIHFGLAESTEIDSVTVRWPGGKAETFKGLQVNSRQQLVQGTGTTLLLDSTPGPLALTHGDTESSAVSTAATVRLLPLLRVPDMFYVDLNKELKPLPITPGKSLLVNLWATWCGPCKAELADFAKHKDALRQKGVEVLALSVDGLGDDRASSGEAMRAMSEPRFGLTGGFATPDLVKGFQVMHDHLLSNTQALPVPTSFLIDGQGQLAVIYKGRLNLEELAEDLRYSSQPPSERLVLAAPRSGSVVDHAIPSKRLDDLVLDRAVTFGEFLWKSKRYADAAAQFEKCLQLADHAKVRLHLGSALERQDRLEEAATQFRKALELDPDFAEAHRNLGVTLNRLGKRQESIEHFQSAVQLKPDYFLAHQELGLLLNRQGRSEESVSHFQEALRSNPDQPAIHFEVAKILHSLAHYGQSIHHNKQALRLDPKNLQVMNHLAWQLATCPQSELRNGEIAVRLADLAGRMTKYQRADILDTLAAANAEAGLFEEAIRWQKKVVELLPSEHLPDARKRLKRYEKGEAYREPKQ